MNRLQLPGIPAIKCHAIPGIPAIKRHTRPGTFTTRRRTTPVVLILVTLFLLHNLTYAQQNPVMHLDANNPATVITSPGSNLVTQWQDLSGNNNHATPLGGSIEYPGTGEFATGKTGVGFHTSDDLMELFSASASDAILDFTGAASGNSGFAILVAFRPDEIISTWNDLVGNTSAAQDKAHLGIRYSSSGSFQLYLGPGVHIQSGTLEQGESVVVAVSYNAGSGDFEFWNSNDRSVRTDNTPAMDFSNGNPIFLGGLRNPPGDRYFNGLVGEVMIFDAALSTEDLVAYGDSMRLKWAVENFETDPPTPDPAAFKIAPHGVAHSLVTMTAESGSDLNEPVKYRFTEVTGNPGGSTSEWTRYATFRDGDLQPETEYRYTVQMKDALGNTGTASDTLSATTPAYRAPGQTNELENRAFYGYQGWHFAPGDGRTQSNNWVHWFEQNIDDAEHIHGDFWPELEEYDPENLYPTQMVYPSGDIARVYSSHDYSTIDLHVKWMKEYGIGGCVVQRFTNSIDSPSKLEQGDKKLRDIMSACEKYGVKFWLMHDAGGGDAEEYDRITNDWIHLVEDLDILQSPAYTYQDGLPVYGLWGIGVNSRDWTPETVNAIADFYQSGPAEYRAYIMGGISSGNWRSLTDWLPVYERLDMVSPWRTIFYGGGPGSQSNIDRMHADKDWCDARGVDYNPVISPGASTLHLRDSDDMYNWTPREGGHFIWNQLYQVRKMGSPFVYVAMFDEVDEGTAMYKMAETPAELPVGAQQVPLNIDGYRLPDDWYLRVGREMQKMMDGTLPLTEEIPITPHRYTLTPVPANEAVNIAPGTDLAWSGFPEADSVHLYLREGDPWFTAGDLADVLTQPEYTMETTLEEETTYHWRVDVSVDGYTVKGTPWSFTTAAASGIESPGAETPFIWPVPATEQLHISTNTPGGTYTIYRSDGVRMASGKLDEKTVDVGSLPPGLYIIKTAENTTRFIKK